MDVLQAIRLDFEQENRILDEIISQVDPAAMECATEQLHEFADSFRADKAALKNVLLNNADIVVTHRDEVDQLSSLNERIDALLSDLTSENCKEAGFNETLSSLAAELNARNVYASQLLDQMENELASETKSKLLTEYERYREDKSEGDRFQKADIPFKRSPRHEQGANT